MVEHFSCGYSSKPLISTPFSIEENGTRKHSQNHTIRKNGLKRRRDREAGFTLMELMIVLVIVGILAAMAVPKYTNAVKKAKEAVLREDLQTMRQAIDSYTVDKEKGPQSLDDLVQAGYLKTIPIDPFTHRSDSWMTDSDGSYSSVDQTDTGIHDVHSGAQDVSTEGDTYNSW